MFILNTSIIHHVYYSQDIGSIVLLQFFIMYVIFQKPLHYSIKIVWPFIFKLHFLFDWLRGTEVFFPFMIFYVGPLITWKKKTAYLMRWLFLPTMLLIVRILFQTNMRCIDCGYSCHDKCVDRVQKSCNRYKSGQDGNCGKQTLSRSGDISSVNSSKFLFAAPSIQSARIVSLFLSFPH